MFMHGNMQITTPTSELLRRLDTYDVLPQLNSCETFNTASCVHTISRYLELVGCKAGKPSGVPTNHCQVRICAVTRDLGSAGVLHFFELSFLVWSTDHSMWMVVPNFSRFSVGVNPSHSDTVDRMNTLALEFMDAIMTMCPPPRNAAYCSC